MPDRIQRKRAAGWRMPASTVYVGRPTRWANHFRIEHYARADAVRMYRELILDRQTWIINPAGDWISFPTSSWPGPVPTVAEIRAELAGLDLACWCPISSDQPMSCHADVLLQIANS